jgi:hypothetical protein
VVKRTGDENLWRVRIGDYRLVYEIHDDRLIVLVLRVANRKDVFRRKSPINQVTKLCKTRRDIGVWSGDRGGQGRDGVTMPQIIAT